MFLEGNEIVYHITSSQKSPVVLSVRRFAMSFDKDANFCELFVAGRDMLCDTHGMPIPEA
jgi:hypothetical protein